MRKGLPLLDNATLFVGDAVCRGRRILQQQLGPLTTVPLGTVLNNSELPLGDVLLLRSGWAAHLRDFPDGRRSIFDLHLPGDLVGANAMLGKPTRSSTVALTTVSYQAVASLHDRSAVQPADVALALWQACAEEQARVDALAVAMACANAEERLAAFLLSVNKRLEQRQLASAGSFRLPMTQGDMGDHLGMTVVHVNRTLRRLRERRLASLSRGYAVIDVDGLTEIAGIFVA
jgi:CRP/FNR family transcriptional regulator